jgi:hypothetical protein
MHFTAEAIATILHAPLANVEAHWPMVVEALGALKILDPTVEAAAIASIGAESYVFAPEKEPGSEAYFRRMYEFDRSLGNVEPGDGAKYCGSGSWSARIWWSSLTWPWIPPWPPGSSPMPSC